MPTTTTRVTCCQLSPRMADLAGNRAMAAAAVGRAVAAGADVVVLPELVTSGYMFASVEEARGVAITTDDAVLGDWADAAGEAVVVGGLCELGADGRLYNSAAVVDADGVRAVYRKTHLWDRERLVFTPGNTPPPVLDTRAGRLGVLVCYDLEFPELSRGLALAGAELLAVPTNWPVIARPAGEHPPEVVIAMATARVNRIAIACCDRRGTERGQEWTAGTTIVDASGWVAATAVDDVATADLDLARARDKVLTPHSHVLRDRRPELYGALVDRGAPVIDISR